MKQLKKTKQKMAKKELQWQLPKNAKHRNDQVQIRVDQFMMSKKVYKRAKGRQIEFEIETKTGYKVLELHQVIKSYSDRNHQWFFLQI